MNRSVHGARLLRVQLISASFKQPCRLATNKTRDQRPSQKKTIEIAEASKDTVILGPYSITFARRDPAQKAADEGRSPGYAQTRDDAQRLSERDPFGAGRL
jgi:hypothetical protein